MGYYQSNYGGYSQNQYWTPGVKFLITANLVVFGIEMLCYALPRETNAYYYLMEYFTLQPDRVFQNFWIWQLVTSAFMHDLHDIFHILFNLLTLFFFGNIVENYYGTKRFLIFYFLAAVFASLVYSIFHFFIGPKTYMLGASGAIMGVLVASACLVPQATVFFYFFFPMKLSTLIWILVGIDIYTVAMPRGGVAATAHLGGALFGYLYYLLSDRIYRYWLSVKKRMEEEYRKEKEKVYKSDRQQVDKILEKIHDHGIQSLSAQEKEILQNASKQYRDGKE